MNQRKYKDITEKKSTKIEQSVSWYWNIPKEVDEDDMSQDNYDKLFEDAMYRINDQLKSYNQQGELFSFLAVDNVEDIKFSGWWTSEGSP